MIREPLSAAEVGHHDGFRWRGKEVSRVEGFSDAVFDLTEEFARGGLDPEPWVQAIEAVEL